MAINKEALAGSRKISSLPDPRPGGARAKDENPEQVKKLPQQRARPLLPPLLIFPGGGEGRRECESPPSLLRKLAGREEVPQEPHPRHPYCVPSGATSPPQAPASPPTDTIGRTPHQDSFELERDGVAFHPANTKHSQAWSPFFIDLWL